jgi:hypothetical protein
MSQNWVPVAQVTEPGHYLRLAGGNPQNRPEVFPVWRDAFGSLKVEISNRFQPFPDYFGAENTDLFCKVEFPSKPQG